MRKFGLIVILLLIGCNTHNPVNEFKVIQQQQALKVAQVEDPVLKTTRVQTDVRFDVKKSESLVSPYIGHLYIKLEVFYQGFSTHTFLHHVEYAYRDEKWVLNDYECIEDGGWGINTIDDSVPLRRWSYRVQCALGVENIDN